MPIASDECVYRINDMEERDAMISRPELPKRAEWNVEVVSLEWRDLCPEDARAHILGGGSCLISGPAGSGKSTLVRSIIEELKKTKSVALISKTHVAADNMSIPDLAGVTADAWTRRHILHGTYAGAVWLDEWTTLDMQQYTLLNALTFGSCQFIVSGDANQMGSCFSSFRGVPIDADQIGQSQFFHALCGGTRCLLTECKRSDKTLFNWFTSIGEGGSRFDLTLAQQVKEARRDFPKRGDARWHLCISHAKRKAINRREMLRLKPVDAMFYPKVAAPGMTSEPQDLWLWPGIEVFACTRSVTKGLKNGMLYTIMSVGEQTILEGNIVLSKEEATKYLRPSFAQTYASSQGLTLEGRVQLCDSSNKHYTSRMLLMGLSRAREASLVQVSD
jgi:energy-coupling factor transporter ATP-binding protein EcfA2